MTLFAQRYELLDELGSGGQATTRLAIDTQTQQHVVIKQLHLAHLENWKAIELFERECQILEVLDHPQIPSYIDAFHDSPTDSAERFVLIQEYIQGETLHAMISQGTRFTEAEILALMKDVLQILDYLHTLSPPVIHRDIKPSNLIRRHDGSWALIDFGAIQAILSEASKIGSTIVGTSGYMAPEQFMGHSAPATDLYALGATIVHIATHTHPADIPLTRLRLDYHALTTLSPPLLALIDDLIAPHIEERPASASDTLARIEHLHTPAPAPTTAPPPPNPPRAYGALVALALISLVVAASFLFSRTRQDDHTPRTAHATRDGARTLFDDDFAQQKQRFEKLSFTLKSDDSRIDASSFSLEHISPHLTRYQQDHVNVGVALINRSELALEELRADVSFMSSSGERLSTKTIDIHQSYQPTIQPGDRMHTDFQVPLGQVSEVVIALHSPAIVTPSTPTTTPQPIELEWLASRPAGCDLTATARKLALEESYRKEHKLELAVENTGTCPLQLIYLEKRVYDADHNVMSTQQTYLNATYDPPLRPGEHLLASLNSHLSESPDSFKVFVLKADLYSPPSP